MFIINEEFLSDFPLVISCLRIQQCCCANFKRSIYNLVMNLNVKNFTDSKHDTVYNNNDS